MSTSRERQQAILICVCLAVLIAAVYWAVGRAEFVNFDDGVYVTANPQVRGGLTVPGVVWAFTTCRSANWHPLTWLSHALDCECFGMNAGRHHAVSVLLHVANTVLLFLVLRRMTGATWRSACVAALFGVHPLHVESVAWVAERKDVLSGLFFILTLGAYTRYVRGPFSMPRYLAVFFLFALALMSKPMVVTLPFVLLLLDYWPLGRTRWLPPVVAGNHVALPSGQLLKEKLPLFALAAVSCGVTIGAQHSGGAISSLERLPLGLRMANAVVAYGRYMEKAVWPSGLAVYYPYRVWPTGAVIVAGAILVAVSVTVTRSALCKPHLAVGWFWFLGTLVPAIGLVQVGSQSMADRYTYLPLIGLFIMLSWSVPARALERWDLKLITRVAAAAMLAVCAALSRVQVEYWKNSETLFQHALDVTRNNWLAHNNLGNALMSSGRLPEAIEHFEQALRINPDYAKAHYSLGVALGQEGKIEDAIVQYEQALRIEPDYAETHNNLGIDLAQAGRIPEAIVQYEQALRIKPDFAEAHNDLGVAFAKLGRLPEAIGHYEQALRVKPDYAEAHGNLGIALGHEGRVGEAIGHYEQALRLKPGDPKAHFNLGLTFWQTGRLREAIGQYEEALRINPDFTEAHLNLGIALSQVGSNQDALVHFMEALRLQPGSLEVHYNFGQALFQMGKMQDAIDHYQQALRIRPDFAEAHFNLGLTLEKMGRTPEAIEQYEQALKLRPDLTAAKDALAQLRDRQ
jgi:tetratricopeptide (TPR) repeat protein